VLGYSQILCHQLNDWGHYHFGLAMESFQVLDYRVLCFPHISNNYQIISCAVKKKRKKKKKKKRKKKGGREIRYSTFFWHLN